MSTLKEITSDLHSETERVEFTKRLLTGKVTKAEYVNYLYQLLMIYNPIEFGCRIQGFFENLEGLYRLGHLYQDYQELAEPHCLGQWLPETLAYHRYLIELLNDPTRRHLIKAHLYVRHCGDMSGGQAIAEKIPGSGKLYAFVDIPLLKQTVLEQLDPHELAEEARTAFAWNLQLLCALSQRVSGD